MHRIAVLTVLVSACAGDTPLEQAFCDVLAGSASRAITATSDEEKAPESAFDATRIDISLFEDEDVYLGFVRFTADEVGSFAFGFDEDVPVQLETLDGDAIAWDNTVQGAACTELAVRHTASLLAESYLLLIGPTSSPMVAMVAEESDDDL